MFQVIFMFSDGILIKQIIVSSTIFVLQETDFQNILPGVLSGILPWVKIHRFNASSRNVNTITLKIFPTHGGICKLEKI